MVQDPTSNESPSSESPSRTEPTEEPPRRVRLLVAYDGTPFAGFARNEGVRTVAGDLEAHLSKVLREPIVVTGAGRTDRGVHAWGQVVTFDTRSERLDLTRLRKSVNSVLGPHIVVREAAIVSSDFDARFSARWRRYHYTILRTETPNPFLAATTWHLSIPLDLDAMRAGAQHLVGQHDFSSFCRRPPSGPGGAARSLERTVLDVSWQELAEQRWRMEITAGAFCHQMVRAITGTLVDVGRGRFAPDDVASILAARDRNAAGRLAPPEGLCLVEVGYDSW